MERVERVAAPCLPAPLFAVVEDLGAYPRWLEIVVGAEPVEAAPGDPGPAWTVELRGRVGPLARSKRLRMVRTEHDPPRRVVFERRELGERSRSPWTLVAEVAEVAAGGSELTMSLRYGGSLWGPMLERLLADEVDRARPRLLALLATGPSDADPASPAP